MVLKILYVLDICFLFEFDIYSIYSMDFNNLIFPLIISLNYSRLKFNFLLGTLIIFSNKNIFNFAFFEQTVIFHLIEYLKSKFFHFEVIFYKKKSSNLQN